jgi:flagellar FliL protein
MPLPEPPPEAAAAPAPAPAAWKRLLLPAALFAGLAAAAVALVLVVLRPLFPPVPAGGAAAHPASAPAAKFGRVVSLDSVVVNLAQSEGRRYLKATIQLEVPEEERVVKEVEARKAQLLDLVVATLARKSLGELTGPEALDRLRGELTDRTRQELGAERVRRVFITEFVVQ